MLTFALPSATHRPTSLFHHLLVHRPLVYATDTSAGSEWFGFYAAGQDKEVESLDDSQLYKVLSLLLSLLALLVQK